MTDSIWHGFSYRKYQRNKAGVDTDQPEDRRRVKNSYTNTTIQQSQVQSIEIRLNVRLIRVMSQISDDLKRDLRAR